MVRALHDPSLDDARLWGLAALFGLFETLARKRVAGMSGAICGIIANENPRVSLSLIRAALAFVFDPWCPKLNPRCPNSNLACLATARGAYGTGRDRPKFPTLLEV